MARLPFHLKVLSVKHLRPRETGSVQATSDAKHCNRAQDHGSKTFVQTLASRCFIWAGCFHKGLLCRLHLAHGLYSSRLLQEGIQQLMQSQQSETHCCGVSNIKVFGARMYEGLEHGQRLHTHRDENRSIFTGPLAV